MTADKAREVLGIYRKKFEEMKIPKRQCLVCTDDRGILSHCHAMLDEMDIFILENRMDKVFRWLGFLQGCLWSTGVFTIEEMKNHNRP